MQILVTGASGMVGYSVCRIAINHGLDVVGWGREDRHKLEGMRFEKIDLLSDKAIDEAFFRIAPDIIVHLAANTNHNSCERNPNKTQRLHAGASGHLALLAQKKESRFIHISTEAVYGTLKQDSHVETEKCHPVGTYAITKREAEESVMQANPSALVLRTTPVGFAPNGAKTTLAEWLLRQFIEKKTITGFTDVLFSPVSSLGLARLIFNPKLNDMRGIYNWGNREVLNKYDFAKALAEILGFSDAKIIPGFRSKEGIPLHGGLDSTALSSALGIPAPATNDLFEELVQNASHL